MCRRGWCRKARGRLLQRGSVLAVLLAAVAAVLLARDVAHARGSLLTFLGVEADGVAGVAGLDGALSAAASPDGAHLYVVSAHADALAVFRRAATTGDLSFVEAHFDGVGGVDGLDGPLGTQAVAVSADGATVYVASAVDDAVAVFSRNAASGTLTFLQVLRDGVGGVDGLDGAWTVTVSPEGSHVYAAGFADHALAVFARDPGTGGLSFVEAEVNGVGGVVGLEDP